jgi:hypothetical protein
MGVLDSISAILGGKGKKTVPVQLNPGELELARSVANLKQVGGDLVVTNQRVVFTPLETADAVVVLTWGLRKAGAPKTATDLVGKLGDLVKQTDLGGIVAVAAGSDGGTFKAPTLLLTGHDSTRTEIAILAGRLKRNGDPANRVARDAMVEKISEAMSSTQP